MSWQLIVRSEAESELAEAIDWYQLQRPGFGDRFLRSFLEAVKKLAENPYLFQNLDDDIRRVRLRDFPYSILYFIRDDRVVVVACAHAKRQPGYWRDRLKSR
jgi:plasmid stabilization system protein ParE